MTRGGKEVGTDGISGTTVDKNADGRRYSINGMILSTLKKGDFFIQGGKKYVAK